MDFHTYYADYMGYDGQNNTGVFNSKYRELPINKIYYYPIMISDYFSDLVCSTSQHYYKLCSDIFEGDKSSIKAIVEALGAGYQLRTFYRYAYEGNSVKSSQVNKPLVLDRKVLQRMNLGEDFDVRNYVLRHHTLIEEKRQFVILDKDQIATRGFVSDVYAGGGNIVVFTPEPYRQNGYGTDIVMACIDWCLHRDILPIYYVEQGNTASIALAEKVGFTRRCQEWIIQQKDSEVIKLMRGK